MKRITRVHPGVAGVHARPVHASPAADSGRIAPRSRLREETLRTTVVAFVGAPFLATLLTSVLASGARAQELGSPVPPAGTSAGGTSAGPVDEGFGFLEAPRVPCLPDEERAWIRANIEWNRSILQLTERLQAKPADRLLYGWPLRAVGTAAQSFDVHGISNFVDLDPAYPNSLRDYRCGTRTYDLASGYNHRGVDFFTWPLGWTWMDEDAVEIVAIAAGTIVLKSDGNFDESCGFGGGSWNAVYVEHDDGTIAWYGHMKKGSPTAKAVGERVARGEYLGVVGSSGSSTGPHLHLELYDPDGKLVAPFEGPCNPTTSRSLWRRQRAYYDSAVNHMTIGTAAVSFPACPGRAVTSEAPMIPPGTTVYFTTYYHDQRAGQVSQYRVIRPNGTIFRSWSRSSTTPHYAASYWWWSYTTKPGAPTGTWTFEVDFEGRTYSKTFVIG